MTGYVIRRVRNAALVVWASFTVTFLLLRLLPSDPVSLKLAQVSSGGASGARDPAVVRALTERYGFDRPLPVQYGITVWRFLGGDLGVSIDTGIPVRTSLAEALPHTVTLTAAAFVLSTAAAGVIAVAAVSVRSPLWRQVLSSLPSVGISLPVFWVGLMLVQVFSFTLGWFPATGDAGVAALVLPTVTLAVPCTAALAQVLTRSLQDTLREPYIDTARAKGVGPVAVHLGHALRNAVIPTLTLAGVTVGNLLAGAVVTETVFSRTGLGRLLQAAVSAQDYPVVLAVVVFCSAAFAVTTLVVDLIYPIVDPRLRVATPVGAVA